jgi:hypothetical protein
MGRRIKSAAKKAVRAATERAGELRNDVAELIVPARIQIEQLADLHRLASPEGAPPDAQLDPEAPLAASTLQAVDRLLGAAQANSSAAQTAAVRA